MGQPLRSGRHLYTSPMRCWHQGKLEEETTSPTVHCINESRAHCDWAQNRLKRRPHEAMVVVGGIVQSSSSDVTGTNVIWAFHAEWAMDRCLCLMNREPWGKVQQPARATGTGSVSLSLSTPECSAEKQDKIEERTGLGSSQWIISQKQFTLKSYQTQNAERTFRLEPPFPRSAICHPSLVVFYSTFPRPPAKT